MTVITYNLGSIQRACDMAVSLGLATDCDFAVRRHLLEVTIRSEDDMRLVTDIANRHNAEDVS